MEGNDTHGWSQWFSKQESYVASRLHQQEKIIIQSNPTLLKQQPTSPIQTSLSNTNENLSLEAYAKAFVRDLKKTKAANASRISETAKKESKKNVECIIKKNSVWDQFMTANTSSTYNLYPSSSGPSINRMLDNRVTLTQTENSKRTPKMKSSIDEFIQEPIKSQSDSSWLSPKEPEKSSHYYQQQSNNLEGGVLVMGKAPTKTERKQSEKKRLNEEKKLLLREMRGDGNTDMRTPGPDHTVIKKKLREIQKGEKRAIQEVLDLSKQRPKRRRKEVVQCKYTFSTHIERYLLPSIERVDSLTPLKNLLEGSHTILFFSVYNTGSTSFGKSETTHDDLANHNLPIAFFLSVCEKKENELIPQKHYVIKLHGDINNDSDVDITMVRQEFQILHTLFYHQNDLTLISWNIQRQLRLFHNYFSKYLHEGFIHSSLMKSHLMDLELLYWLTDSDYQERKAIEFSDICSFMKIPTVDLSLLWSNMDPIFFDLTVNCLSLYTKLLMKLEPPEKKAYEVMEKPLMVLLSYMDCTGVSVQFSTLQHIKPVVEKYLEQIEEEVMEMMGRPINLSSPKQVHEVLFKELKLKCNLKESISSTSEKVLKTLVDQHPLPGLIIKYRKYSKLMSSYVEGLIKECIPSNTVYLSPDCTSFDPNTTCYSIFTTWNQKATGTGRLSSTNPNLQTLPKKSLDRIELDEKVSIRTAFTVRPSSNTVFISVDYKQIEMRLFAHFTNDSNLIQLMTSQENNDIYKLIASFIHNDIPLNEVTQQQREGAKVITLGLCYGMGIESMASQLAIPTAEAVALKNRILTKFPGIQQFINESIQKGREHHYAETIIGRRRRLRVTNKPEELNKIDRQAVNTVVQGSAADLLKVGMILLWEKLEKLDCRMVLQIHDELVIECPNDPKRIDEVKGVLKKVLSIEAKKQLQEIHNQNHPDQPQEFIVPLDQSIQIGTNLGFC